MNRFKEMFKPGIVVSCQALKGEPLYRPEGGIMCLMALAAERNGAIGIRANDVVDIPQIAQTVDLPIISILKRVYDDAEVYITPTMDEVDELMATGVVKCIAIDCTIGTRPNGENINDFIPRVKEKYPDLVIMADISTYEEAINAYKLGVDVVSTTMYGYTPWSQGERPAVELIRRLTSEIDIPVVAEGGVRSEQNIADVFQAGAYACVIGGAITRPQEICERYIGFYNREVAGK